MRKELKRYNGERLRFTAEVERFGEKASFRGAPIPTLLLKNVRILGQEVIITDHLWFTKGKSWDACRPGTHVAFDARVTPYEKGYKGRKEVFDAPVMIDYRLERPTKIEVLSDAPVT